MTYSLEVYHDEHLFYTSNGKWLHPLFDLERYLAAAPVAPEELRLKDIIIGRAAAMLIIRMGIRNVYGRIISKPALEIFSLHGISPGYGEVVEKIACMTEELLAGKTDIEAAYSMLLERASNARR